MMKKLLLIAATMGIAATSNAQARLALYEEFTGENCGPCASTNPDFDDLVLKPANASKVQVIKYQANIPAGPTKLYPQAKVFTDARQTYYTISSAPSGKLDGLTSSPSSLAPGHPGYFSQSEIDAEAAIASPFTIAVAASWDATSSNIVAKIDVAAISAYTGSGSVYLRTAIVQSVNYCTAPGSNGETHFTNVVRSMYPNALGTSVAATWAIGTTQTYNFTIPVPDYVDKKDQPYIVVWIQADGDKKIAQSAKSASLPSPSLLKDASQTCATNTAVCISGGTGPVTHTVMLKNNGTSAMTTADIYYKLGAAAYVKYTWTGSLAAGASTSVAMPAVTVTAAGNYLFTDSIDVTGDENKANNVATSIQRVISKDPVAMPSSFNFESQYNNSYFTYDFDKSGEIMFYTYARVGSGSSTYSIAHSGDYLGWAQLFGMASGATAYLVMPSPNLTVKPLKLEFWEAYAQQTASNNDKLEVVYSTNCGTSWTALWSKSGSAHSTASPTAYTSGTSGWLPASATSADWQKRSVDISAIPAGAIMALRVTSNGGNNLFIDDINIATNVGINENTAAVSTFEVYPNPAREMATTKFTLTEKSNVAIEIVDMVGKVVKTVANKSYAAGTFEVPTTVSELASGLYLVKITTDKGSSTERLSVVK